MIFQVIPAQSPACAQALRRILVEEQLFQIDQAFQESVEKGLNKEWFYREPGVSFNPKTARLLQLGIEASITSLEMLKQILYTALEIENQDFTNIQSHSSTPYCLDWLRHYHLMFSAPLSGIDQNKIKVLHEKILLSTDFFIKDETLPLLFRKKLSDAMSRSI